MNIDEKIRAYIGDLVIRNIALDDQVTKLTERLAEIEKKQPEKKSK